MNKFEIRMFDKQPNDVLDYDFDFSAFLPSTDTINTANPTVTPGGITLGASVINNSLKVVKQWISGGTDGNVYTITLTITTSEGRTKEVELKMRVKALP